MMLKVKNISYKLVDLGFLVGKKLFTFFIRMAKCCSYGLNFCY